MMGRPFPRPPARPARRRLFHDSSTASSTVMSPPPTLSGASALLVNIFHSTYYNGYILTKD